MQVQASIPPADVAEAIRTAKVQLRSDIGDVGTAYAIVLDHLRPAVAEIVARRDAGGSVWPEVSYDDLAASGLDDGVRDLVRRRGCLVVRGHFSHDQALDWDRRLEAYVDANDFATVYRGAGDDFFGTTSASKPSIYPVYWSPTQMEARQSERMAVVQSFLNRLWTFESEGTVWFNPDVNTLYPDRIRRRPPGTDNDGLGAHCDSGSLERWLLPEYRRVYRALFDGKPQDYDPWDAAYRPLMNEYEGGTTMCSAFRTFQGWTALSDMENDQGVLHVLPIPEAIGAILLRALLPDVPEDGLCGAMAQRVLPVLDRWHPELLAAMTPIPDLKAGDSVWWHADLVHSVGAVRNQKGWGNVMYIPAAPMCDKNLTFARQCYADFVAGRSPQDFPQEDYEVGWTGRFAPADLNDNGRRGLGLAE